MDSTGIDTRMQELAESVNKVVGDVDTVKRDLTLMSPEVKSVTKNVNALTQKVKEGIRNNMPRFSCSVTSDEIRTSGVITYNICNVNQNELMNRETGHVTVKESGDYYLTFSGNMVSVDSQAVWCALYKQSSGNEGWQVLGMINNYSKTGNGGKTDDRDSGSLAVIASLKEGDQVWVEWRGYGESYLYSNPYRLISFTGFMINKA